ncbi:MAG: molecular chaperone GrpE [Alphaproteobacteria bacterium]|nr:molecular chaperone GrpE [Alphaproteobacteria bacterium]
MTHSIEDEAVATEAVDMGTLIAENASLRDRLLRALAEAENTRRRADRVAEDARKFAVAEFARELLNAVDNLERTVEAAREQAAAAKDATLIEGVQATLRGLRQTLERFGVRRIEALGQRFDPNLHEAVMEVEDREQPPGTVTRVLQQGYTIHDRLLRPARVVVTKRPVRAQPELEDNDLGSEWGSRSVGQR